MSQQNPSELRVVDLFCGAGGFSTGFAGLGEHTAHLAFDNDSQFMDTYRRNFPHARAVLYDISELHSTQIEHILGGRPDILIASPPCEEFSLANPRSEHSAAERIYGDGSARLVLDTIRLIGDLRPKVFVVENVAALVMSGGREIVQWEFERVGIGDVKFNMIYAHRHGVPSRRARVFISNLELRLPQRKPPTVMEAIGDLPPLGLDALLDPGRCVANHQLKPLTEEDLKRIRRTRSGRGAKYFTTGGRSLPNWVRLKPDSVASSVIGLSRYVHPFENRLLSVREHARLMSYHDSFVFLGPIESQYNQVGESVPPLLSRLIAQEVISQVEW
ncbi:MAG: DNA cytosine methyltransferase [Candidatus Thorarchaeota archaeon]|nr:DNA cytosine methyltransferase [Candidatus Thorarchaeota archaeon]